jgi:hypothetical protein
MVTGMRGHGDFHLAAARSAFALARDVVAGHRKSLALVVTFVGCAALGGLFGEGAGVAYRTARGPGVEPPAAKHDLRLNPARARIAPRGSETVIPKQAALDIEPRVVKTTAIVLGEPEASEPAASPPQPAARPASVPMQAPAARAEAAPLPRDTEPRGADAPWSVQLASERSESQALEVFERIRNEHQAILGGLRPQVTMAELGAKGVYYRVRIGFRSQEAASRLCASLQAASGSCWVQRN